MLVIPKEYRGQGVATALLGKAVEFARSQGATVIEGYPVEPRKGKMPDFWVWMGLASMFKGLRFRRSRSSVRDQALHAERTRAVDRVINRP